MVVSIRDEWYVNRKEGLERSQEDVGLSMRNKK